MTVVKIMKLFLIGDVAGHSILLSRLLSILSIVGFYLNWFIEVCTVGKMVDLSQLYSMTHLSEPF